MKDKDKLAFIGHSLSVAQLYKFLGPKSILFRPFGKEFLKGIILKHLKPQCSAIIKDFSSNSGHTIDFQMLVVPLLPDQFVTMPEEIVLSKILVAIRYGYKRGAKLASLGGFTSVVGNEGELISRQSPIPVTSGNTYTACLTIDGILKAAHLMEIDISESTAAVVGATGDIGSICTKILAGKVKRVNIAARNERRLGEFSDSLKKERKCQVEVFKYSQEAVRDADVVLTVTSAITTVINVDNLKPGAVICDVAYPANIAKEVARRRNDVLVFEGGLAKPPMINGILDKKRWKDGLPPGCIFGCLAEGLVLTLAGRFENYSLGRGNITEDKIDEIRAIAEELGFGVSDFYCGDKIFSEQCITEIRKNARMANKV